MNEKLYSFLNRFSYFLLGLAIGIFLLNFFLSKKNVQFDYLPNARTLKSIRNKPHIDYSSEVIAFMVAHKIDSTDVQSLLLYGDVNFKKSSLKTKPCVTYLIEPTKKSAPFSILIERCDSTAIVKNISFED